MYVGLDLALRLAMAPARRLFNLQYGAQPYKLDWERLEMRGDSNDFVVVGGGLQGTDASAKAVELDTSDFFQIDLGSGNDTLYVTDASQSITLDLSAIIYYVVADRPETNSPSMFLAMRCTMDMRAIQCPCMSKVSLER